VEDDSSFAVDSEQLEIVVICSLSSVLGHVFDYTLWFMPLENGTHFVVGQGDLSDFAVEFPAALLTFEVNSHLAAAFLFSVSVLFSSFPVFRDRLLLTEFDLATFPVCRKAV